MLSVDLPDLLKFANWLGLGHIVNRLTLGSGQELPLNCYLFDRVTALSFRLCYEPICDQVSIDVLLFLKVFSISWCTIFENSVIQLLTFFGVDEWVVVKMVELLLS